ncbi:crossover junction endonuclease EME1 isoform X3 [Coturnix japonica]|uniref:crossover junction endonuclease EME1 isoform X3 n=1 Tax=Coturnix japonica TaxID=93934 RepID=UPI000776EF4D|nr:crossover junction endonuclease EME1 isoform X3 [Coturnix japonica]
MAAAAGSAEELPPSMEELPASIEELPPSIEELPPSIEELPPLAALLQPLPTAGSAPAGASCPSVRPGGGVVVLSSDSEDEVEVAPLSERLRRRLVPPSAGVGAGAGGRGLCPSDGRRELLLVDDGGDSALLPPDGRSVSPVSAPGAGGHSLPPAAAVTERPEGAPGSGGREGASPPPKKAKYSQQERGAVCRAGCERRKEREARKRQQEEERERRKVLGQVLKAQRPGQCQKYISAVLDTGTGQHDRPHGSSCRRNLTRVPMSALLQLEGGAQIRAALQAANYSCVVESQAVPCSVTWRRKAVLAQAEDGNEWTEEPNLLVLLGLEEFLSMVHSYKQAARGCAEQKETLQSFVARVMEKMPGKILALTVVEVEKYFRCLRAQSKKRLQQTTVNRSQGEDGGDQRKKQVNHPGLEITRLDVEDALVDLQLCTRVQVTFFESWEELGEFAAMFTKAVAEAPFKREQQNTGFSFYLENKWCRGVKVDHSGKGLLEVWKRQIQQFNRVSGEMAEAVVSAYPSPQLLVQLYRTEELVRVPLQREKPKKLPVTSQ